MISKSCKATFPDGIATRRGNITMFHFDKFIQCDGDGNAVFN